MKKKIMCLVLAVSITASMTAVAFATDSDHPKACRPVLLIKEVSAK